MVRTKGRLQAGDLGGRAEHKSEFSIEPSIFKGAGDYPSPRPANGATEVLYSTIVLPTEGDFSLQGPVAMPGDVSGCPVWCVSRTPSRWRPGMLLDVPQCGITGLPPCPPTITYPDQRVSSGETLA